MRKPKNWGQPCPNKNCEHYGQLNKDNLISQLTYMTQSGKRRIFHCNICGTDFSKTHDTVFFDLKTPEDKVIMALKMILGKVGLSEILFFFYLGNGEQLSDIRY